jgi:hypothetical protein
MTKVPKCLNVSRLLRGRCSDTEAGAISKKQSRSGGQNFAGRRVRTSRSSEICRARIWTASILA